jgi:hypothetical protein
LSVTEGGGTRAEFNSANVDVIRAIVLGNMDGKMEAKSRLDQRVWSCRAERDAVGYRKVAVAYV